MAAIIIRGLPSVYRSHYSPIIVPHIYSAVPIYSATRVPQIKMPPECHTAPQQKGGEGRSAACGLSISYNLML